MKISLANIYLHEIQIILVNEFTENKNNYVIYVILFLAEPENILAHPAFVGFLLSKDDIFMSSHFSLITIASHGTLHLVLVLVGMHSAAASMWAVTKFSYLSFGVCVLDIL